MSDNTQRQQEQGQPARLSQMGDSLAARSEFERQAPRLVVDNDNKKPDFIDKTQIYSDFTDHSKNPVIFVADSHAEAFGKEAEDFYKCFKETAIVFESDEGRDAFYSAAKGREWYISQFDIGVMDGYDDEETTNSQVDSYDFGIILGDINVHNQPFFDQFQKEGGTIFKCVLGEKHDFEMGKLAAYIGEDKNRIRPHVPNRFTP